MRDGFTYIYKADLLTSYSKARIEAMTPTIAHSDYKAIELVPNDTDRVLSKLNTQFRSHTPPPASTLLQEWIPETPKHPKAVDVEAKSFKESLQHCMHPDIPSSPTESAF